MIVTIAGKVGSGKSKIIGANALIHGSLGKEVVIITDEHDGKEYVQVNEHLKLDTTDINLTVLRVGDLDLRDDSFELVLGKLRGRKPDVLMLDVHTKGSTELAYELQQYLTVRYRKLVTLYVSVQTANSLSIG